MTIDFSFQKKRNKAGYKTVADGWAGAVMQKPLTIDKCDGPTDRQAKLRVCD